MNMRDYRVVKYGDNSRKYTRIVWLYMFFFLFSSFQSRITVRDTNWYTATVSVTYPPIASQRAGMHNVNTIYLRMRQWNVYAFRYVMEAMMR